MQSSQRALLAAVARLVAAEPQPFAAGALVRGLSSLASRAPAATPTALSQPAVAAAASQTPLWRAPMGLWHAQRQCIRCMSASAQDPAAAANAAVEDTLRPKILRLFACLMIATAGVNVLPAVAAASVANCLALMDAEQPFIVKAGCSRLQLLMRAEAGRQRAVQEGAARKLLRLVQAPGADEGVVDYALATLEALAGCEAGLVSLREEGGQAALESYLAGVQRSPTTEDAIYRAQALLGRLAELGEL